MIVLGATWWANPSVSGRKCYHITMLGFDQIAIVHLAATGFMVGLIWTIHVVHYPLFALVPEPYAPFQSEHMSRITKLLVLPWGVEALSAVALVVAADAGFDRTLALIGLVLLAAVVLVTGGLAAPAHGQLLEHFDADIHRRLLSIDLVRSLLWSARLVVAVALVWP